MIDTHVLASALSASLRPAPHDVENEDLKLLECVRETCCRIVIGRDQEREMVARIARTFRARGNRLQLAASPILRELNERKKVTVLPASQVATDPEVARAQRGKGHADTRDDTHLYAVAAEHGGVVVTRDEAQLANAAHMRKTFGIDVVTVTAALADAG